jgi:hypothetical protein
VTNDTQRARCAYTCNSPRVFHEGPDRRIKSHDFVLGQEAEPSELDQLDDALIADLKNWGPRFEQPMGAALKLAADRIESLQSELRESEADNAQLTKDWKAAMATWAESEVELREARAVIEKVRELHRPYGIYGECGHDHEPEDEGVVLVEDIGYTCDKEYDVCSACCASEYSGQSEFCVDAHDHGPGKPICPTFDILPKEDER